MPFVDHQYLAKIRETDIFKKDQIVFITGTKALCEK
jgi:hypothetical protein